MKKIIVFCSLFIFLVACDNNAEVRINKDSVESKAETIADSVEVKTERAADTLVNKLDRLEDSID